jgi:tetratricopeptide (TPR) repeat protein
MTLLEGEAPVGAQVEGQVDAQDAAAPDHARATPGADAVRAALAGILAAQAFRACPQLGAFLRYVVEAALAGRGASLKGYTIGVEALGRDPSFNPQIDPIVRVEATRLRRALERYYAGEGRDDAVIIRLARGSYVPCFAHRDDAPLAPAPLPPPAATRRQPARALPALILAAAVLALVGLVLLPHGADQGASAGAAAAASAVARGPMAAVTESRLPPGNGMPTIYIAPLRVLGAPSRGAISAAALTDKIRDAFAPFDTVNVAFDPPPAAAPDYRLVGTIAYREDAVTLRFELIATAENTVAWSRSFDFPAAAEPGAAEDGVVVALTSELLQSYGVIRARDRARQLASPAGDPRYRCVLEAADSLRFLDRALHERARTCLERLTALDPSFAVGFEFLSLVYYREYALGYPRSSNGDAGDAPPLERALRAARHAIELAPASARAWQDLFVVLYARHDVADAFAAGDKAMALNKYDMLTVAEYGSRLVMTGDVARGLAMLHRAAGRDRTVLPAWHHFYLFLGEYLAGDLAAAAFNAGQITADDYPLGLVARAIAASRSGHAEEAHRAIERLIALAPAWRTDARRMLATSIYDGAIVDRLLHDLAAAGLPAAT